MNISGMYVRVLPTSTMMVFFILTDVQEKSSELTTLLTKPAPQNVRSTTTSSTTTTTTTTTMATKHNTKSGSTPLHLSTSLWLLEVIACMNYLKTTCIITVLDIKNYFNYDKFKSLHTMNINVVLTSCFILWILFQLNLKFWVMFSFIYLFIFRFSDSECSFLVYGLNITTSCETSLAKMTEKNTMWWLKNVYQDIVSTW